MRSTYLVAMRDYLGYVTAWGFWLGLFFTPVLLGIFMIAPNLAAQSAPPRYFTVIDAGGEFDKALQSEFYAVAVAKVRDDLAKVSPSQSEEGGTLEAFNQAIESGVNPQTALEMAGGSQVKIPRPSYIRIPSPVQTVEELRPYLEGQLLVDTANGPQPLFAAIFVPEDGGDIQYWSENLQARDLLTMAGNAEFKLARSKIYAAANVSPNITDDIKTARRDIAQQLLRDSGATTGSKITIADRAPFIVSMMMAFMLWFLIFSVINYLLMGTIEERSNKIFDSLLTSVKLPNLLAGKLLAVLALALTLMAFWALGSTAITLIASKNFAPETSKDIMTILAVAGKPSLVIPAVISFVLGYLMYGSLFLALGSLCDTIQEAQTLMTPLIVLLMTPLFMLVLAINDAQSPIIEAMVWVPLFTPFLLILRMPTEPPLWEVMAQLGLMAVAAFGILYLATRVYRAGAVHGAGVADVWAFFGRMMPGKKKVADQG